MRIHTRVRTPQDENPRPVRLGDFHHFQEARWEVVGWDVGAEGGGRRGGLAGVGLGLSVWMYVYVGVGRVCTYPLRSNMSAMMVGIMID